MRNNHALDAFLHANAPIPLSEVRKLIDEALNRERAEFLEDLNDMKFDYYDDHEPDFIEYIEKWEAKKNEVDTSKE